MLKKKLGLEKIILKNIPEFICVVIGKDNNIIYPTDSKTLKEYRDIVSCETPIKGIYHVESTDQWYEKYDEIDIYEGKFVQVVFFKNITRYKKIEQELQKDLVTGISNRQHTISRIDDYIEYALNNDEEFSVILADVDYFKNINDTYGHFFGDIVLKNIGELINNNIRSSERRVTDIGGRFGGDELFGLLKNISYEDTELWKQRAEESVSKLVHVSSDGKTSLSGVSVSIGSHHVNKEELNAFRKRYASTEEIRKSIYARCDENLYQVKDKHHLNLSLKRK